MDKKALITGSTKGIGRAIGLELLSSGCMVVFNYAKDEPAARQLKDELDNLGFQGHYQIVQADLSVINGCDSLLQKLDKRFDQLDYLVLNAGATWYCGLREMGASEWEQILRINLTVPFFLVQKCADRMQPNGCILFTGAVMGQFPHARSIPYGTSKAGVHYLTKALVKEFAEKQVRVNCISPGFVETEWQNKKTEDIRRSIENKIALHRFASPKEVALMACSILENPYMNGSIVNVDGGYCFQ